MTDRAPRLRGDPWTWVGLLCAIAFVSLAVIVNEQGAVGFDESVISFVKDLPVPTDVWLVITQAAGLILVPIGIAIVVALLALRRVRTAVICASALAGARRTRRGGRGGGIDEGVIGAVVTERIAAALSRIVTIARHAGIGQAGRASASNQ